MGRLVRIEPHKATDDEMLNCAITLSQRLVSSLPTTVDPAMSIAKIPFKVVSIREVLLHRAAELAEVSCALFTQKRIVSAFMVTRGLLETAALLCDLHGRVIRTADSSALDDLDGFLMQALLGTREPDTKVRALNVLTIIKRVAKKMPFFLQSYDILSEFAHPNWSGGLASYSKRDKGSPFVTNLGAEVASVSPRVGLRVLVGTLEVFIFYYNDLGSRIPEFIRLCEDALAKK